MQIEKMKLFAQLLEAYLPEDSSAMGTMSSVPGGREVVQHLHKNMRLAHDQQYKEEPKISWSDLKNNRYGAWVLIKGDKGAGAIRSDPNGEYKSVAFDPATGEVESFISGSGGANINFLKSKIGQLRRFYIGTATKDLKDKKQKRRELASEPGPDQIDVDKLINKFRPIWLTAMKTAEADIRGMIVNMIKNSAYDKAKRKMDQAGRLLEAIERLESGTLSDSDVPAFIKLSVNLAVLMTAAHYYPDETGQIQKTGYGTYYAPSRAEGQYRVLKDISQGDGKKLSTVLAFFKRSLVSG